MFCILAVIDFEGGVVVGLRLAVQGRDGEMSGPEDAGGRWKRTDLLWSSQVEDGKSEQRGLRLGLQLLYVGELLLLGRRAPRGSRLPLSLQNIDQVRFQASRGGVGRPWSMQGAQAMHERWTFPIRFQFKLKHFAIQQHCNHLNISNIASSGSETPARVQLSREPSKQQTPYRIGTRSRVSDRSTRVAEKTTGSIPIRALVPLWRQVTWWTVLLSQPASETRL